MKYSVLLILASLLTLGANQLAVDPVEIEEWTVPWVSRLAIAAERGDSESSKPFMTLTVIAENLGDSRVTWGNGSSACQFDVIVDVDGTEHSISRICTADYVEHGLDPDEARIEELRWDGTILVAGELKALPPGAYPVRAVAGDAISPTISVNIEAIR